MKERKYRWLKEGEFADIKAMLSIKGMTVPLACKISKRSYGTVRDINKASDFTAFHKKRHDWYKRNLAKKGYDPMKAAINPVQPKTQLDRIEGMLTLLLKDRKEKGWLEKLM